mmetsp:Transcript_4252/g.6676  ORF Transcript_4252/g.6676 Transcript_4252/m.6676 type:complete len:206 (-) Transcript_4252:4696-5313(-)
MDDTFQLLDSQLLFVYVPHSGKDSFPDGLSVVHHHLSGPLAHLHLCFGHVQAAQVCRIVPVFSEGGSSGGQAVPYRVAANGAVNARNPVLYVSVGDEMFGRLGDTIGRVLSGIDVSHILFPVSFVPKFIVIVVVPCFGGLKSSREPWYPNVGLPCSVPDGSPFICESQTTCVSVVLRFQVSVDFLYPYIRMMIGWTRRTSNYSFF